MYIRIINFIKTNLKNYEVIVHTYVCVYRSIRVPRTHKVKTRVPQHFCLAGMCPLTHHPPLKTPCREKDLQKKQHKTHTHTHTHTIDAGAICRGICFYFLFFLLAGAITKFVCCEARRTGRRQNYSPPP